MKSRILKRGLLSLVFALMLLGCSKPSVAPIDPAKETVAILIISPNGGEFATGQQISLTYTIKGAAIHYTLDGSEPTTNSPLYSAPFTVSANTKVKAIALKTGIENSAIATASFGREEQYATIKVEGALFSMGSPVGDANSDNDERPVRDVTLSSFWMSQYEITQKQYLDLMTTWPSSYGPSATLGMGDTYPVYYVSWFDALEFCNKLSEQEGLDPSYMITKGTPSMDQSQWRVTYDSTKNGYRLPTEAEWEYAAKGGINKSPFIYSGSNTVDEIAWHSVNSGDDNGIINRKTHPVGGKVPNALELFDMNGNVWEWCWDWYAGSYPDESQINPVGPEAGSYRTLRGASFYGGSSFSGSASALRVANRNYDYAAAPTGRANYTGFRIVRSYFP